MPTSNIIPKKTRSGRKSRRGKCDKIPTVAQVLHKFECPDCCDEKYGGKMSKSVTYSDGISNQKPDNISKWSWELQQQKYGAPPSKTQFRTQKFRWQEKEKEKERSKEEEACEEEEECNKKKKYINPFRRRKRATLSGAQKRKVVEKWGKMWESALSDFQFDRKVFENNPDGEQIYKNDNERINDGCQKLCAIAKMNQNVITMMMKKFVSGPPAKLYTLNRIEAAQCWSRIINDRGVVNDNCCVDLPVRPSRKDFNIPSLNTPKGLMKRTSFLQKDSMFKLPGQAKPGKDKCTDYYAAVSKGSSFKRNPTYWLDPKTVPAVPPGFKEEEFQIDPKDDPTGEIRRDLMKAKETAKRYTRFAHIIEKAIHVIPNLSRMNETMDEHFVARDPLVRRQTLLRNFFSSPKMETSPEFKKDALYATILSRNDNPRGVVVKKPFPYSMAEMAKSKSRTNLTRVGFK